MKKIFLFRRFDLTAKVALLVFCLAAETKEQAEQEIQKLGIDMTGVEFLRELTRSQFYAEFSSVIS